MNSFAGGYDLSSLKQKSEPQAAAPAAPVALPSLVFDCVEQNLRDVLQISARVPVVFEFHADSRQKFEFSDRLAARVRALGGKIVLARVDAGDNPRVATAFSITGVPSVLAVLKGQPAPLFEGQADDETIDKVLEQVLKVAGENGVNSVAIEDAAAPPLAAQTPELPPLHQEAYDAIGRLDFDAAIAAYTKALNEAPGDEQAKAGLAQVKLMKRTIDVDPATLSPVAPEKLEELLQWADVRASSGDFESAFAALLDAFAAKPETREELRKHLLELFQVVEPSNPSLISARARLASLLY